METREGRPVQGKRDAPRRVYCVLDGNNRLIEAFTNRNDAQAAHGRARGWSIVAYSPASEDKEGE